jgi:hypothetical protein
MNEERMKILEMLAAGKITAEQAGQLIEALEADAASKEVYSVGQRSRNAYEGATTTLPKQIETGQASGWNTRAQGAGLTHFTLDQIITLSEHEIDPSFIKELREAGLTDLTFEQIIELSEHEIDPEFVRRLRRAGLPSPTFEQIIELSEHEIDPDYIKRVLKVSA